MEGCHGESKLTKDLQCACVCGTLRPRASHTHSSKTNGRNSTGVLGGGSVPCAYERLCGSLVIVQETTTQNSSQQIRGTDRRQRERVGEVRGPGDTQTDTENRKQSDKEVLTVDDVAVGRGCE